MSKDAERSGSGSRLWSGASREKAEPADDKVVPLARLASLPDRAYVAFETRDRAERLHIRCAAQPSRFPSYNYLLDIIYDHDFESSFTLIYSFMMVEVTGQHLAPIVHALNFGNCERLHEYHRKLYDPPAKEATVITAITITAAHER